MDRLLLLGGRLVNETSLLLRKLHSPTVLHETDHKQSVCVRNVSRIFFCHKQKEPSEHPTPLRAPLDYLETSCRHPHVHHRGPLRSFGSPGPPPPPFFFLQELLRRHSEFSPRVLQSSLVAMGAGSGVTKTGGVEAPGGNNDPGDGKGGGGGGGTVGAGAASKVAAAERTKTVLACLFEALGAKRATREVGRVLCMISAGMAEGVAAAAEAAASAAAAAEAAVEAAAAEAPRWARGGVAEAVAVVVPEAAAAAAEAPPALLPVLASLPEQCVDIVGLALELLETGQAAADVLAREGGTGTDRTAMFALVDATGR